MNIVEPNRHERTARLNLSAPDATSTKRTSEEMPRNA